MKKIMLLSLVPFFLLLTGCNSVNFKPIKSKPSYTVHIIHGFGATPNDHWFRWLEKNLVTKGYKVDNIALPNSHSPNFQQWQNTLESHIDTPNSQDIFIAHSLGNVTLLHYLSNSKATCVAGLVLVSGFENTLPKLPMIENFNLDNYVNKASINNERIKALTPNIYSIVSDNDYLVDPTESQKLASNLNSQVFMVKNGGHLLKSDGYTQLPIALELINKISANNKPSCN